MNNFKETLCILHEKYEVLGIVDCDRHKDSWIDLYLDLRQYKKDTFLPDQKIIVKLTEDYYSNEPCGAVLKSLQNIINELDIPNFFVCLITNNQQIDNEYKFVLSNFSIDDIPINIVSISGEFQQIVDSDIEAYDKRQNFSKYPYTVLEKLTDTQKRAFFKTKSFCIIPWISMMIGTTSDVKPCCFYNDDAAGNVKEYLLKDIWHNKNFNDIRKKILQGEKVPGCSHCYSTENNNKRSPRQNFNAEFLHHANKIDQTNIDGSLSYFKLAYIDARYNNLCNLTCRMCDWQSSSKWFKPSKDLGLIDSGDRALLTSGLTPGDLLNQIKQHIHTVEKIYFAGGEPMMIDEFYKILELLDNNQRWDVQLVYNINLTTLELGDKNIFKYWKNFKKISIGASLDASGDRAKYLRSGTRWDQIVKNRKQILKERPDIDFWIAATASNINALHLPDFHKEWVELGLINIEDFNINLVHKPYFMNINNSPSNFKKLVQKKYNNHINWLKNRDEFGRAVESFQMVTNSLNDNIKFQKKEFWKEVNILDSYFGDDLLNVFPELECFK